MIQEHFGDGIMSAIDFTLDVDKVEDPKGDRVKITMCGKFLPYKSGDYLIGVTAQAQPSAGLFSCPELFVQLLAGRLPSRFILQGLAQFQKMTLAVGGGDTAESAECRVGDTVGCKPTEPG